MQEAVAVRQPNLKDFGYDALREKFQQEGWSAYRADQVLRWIYARGVSDVRSMTDLPVEVRDRLIREWEMDALSLKAVQKSQDGTRKLALRTRDGSTIEAVMIPEERRNTLCVSTQVGCPLACSFCATGAMGLTRNLRASEIVEQVLLARSVLDPDETLTNVVYMGMGEPLLNWSAVAESIRILTHPKTLAMAPRRLTVSTSGIVPRIRALLELAPVNLAISLHATTDAVRDILVPLNRRFPLATLLGTLKSEPLIGRRRPVFFEYTLMEGINDSIADARRLPSLLQGIPCKLNVIPMNPHADAPQRPPDRAVCDAFMAELHRAGLRVTLRRNRGADIDAACGQLAAREATEGRSELGGSS
ncbi:MAG: 23S rRNA (adenine(2503)-C(2))-methyltransferase RlmN [Myxococcota bacterium]|nr:23S rRNA (adenine(2503)-C(2))-methyltransferase RlmN [Myxococcota bacterium]